MILELNRVLKQNKGTIPVSLKEKLEKFSWKEMLEIPKVIKKWASALTDRSDDPLSQLIVKEPGRKFKVKVLENQNEAVYMDYEHLVKNYEWYLALVSSKLIKDFKNTFRSTEAEYFVGLAF